MPHTPTNTALRGTTALIRRHEKLKLHLEVFFFSIRCTWNQSVLSALLLGAVSYSSDPTEETHYNQLLALLQRKADRDGGRGVGVGGGCWL